MSATTIKIEDPLLSRLRKFQSNKESITVLVRGILERDVRRRQMMEGARKYVDFLESNPKERAWLEKLEKANLENPPPRSFKKQSA